ncbi:MAG TPA: NAD(P)H-hydrate dehydratase, partial [Saprospiraceae bacterium]|nr:NAD(P)H-hydrate dehydratase [Saprospiraceae bacterium]
MQRQHITSVQLMERAGGVFVDWFKERFGRQQMPIVVLCGTGNNGGDGLVIARLMHAYGYEVRAVVLDFSGRRSPEFEHQWAVCEAVPSLPLTSLSDISDLPPWPKGAMLIDAIFGSGLNRPLQRQYAAVADWVHASGLPVVAVDIPTGLLSDAHTAPRSGLRAAHTLIFEVPKLAFFFPENAEHVGEWAVRSIGLDRDFAEQTSSTYHWLDAEYVRRLVLPRRRFSHKGTFGHALLVAGSRGKMGAAVLAARACLRAGAGLLTLRSAGCGLDVLQGAVPEAMCDPDPEQARWTECPDLERYAAIGVGCGIGTAEETAEALEALLEQSRQPLVLDADALNILAQRTHLWAKVPAQSILTPHPKEFERLFGAVAHDFDRNRLQCDMAQQHGIYILLKGAHSAMACPDGTCWFNSTGNPGMATGGSGDVLTGVLTGLLAQGYDPRSALLLGVYLHGLAGNLAAAAQSQQALLASDLVDCLGKAWLHLQP